MMETIFIHFLYTFPEGWDRVRPILSILHLKYFFQTVEILDTILDDDQTDFYRIETARDIIINIEGSVHFNTFYLNRNNRK